MKDRIWKMCHCTVVSSSSVTGTLNTALNELYLLMRILDLNQIFTRPRC